MGVMYVNPMLENRRALVKKIANERISILFELAENTIKEEPSISHRYVYELREISTHYKVKIPRRMKNQICTRCNVLLYPGITSKVRVVSSHRYVAYVCNRCRKEVHVRY
jgi:ribonuclease P protein subunit RPR2